MNTYQMTRIPKPHMKKIPIQDVNILVSFSLFFFFTFYYETELHTVAQAGQVLTVWPRSPGAHGRSPVSTSQVLGF